APAASPSERSVIALRTRLLKLTAACAAAIAISGIGASGAGAVSKEFYGVISINFPTSSGDFAAMGRGQVGTLRFLLNWSTVEPVRGSRDWSDYDAMIENAALNGVRTMPTVFGSPAFAAATPEAPPGPAAEADFASFLAEAAARYGEGGSFWSRFVSKYPGAQPLPFKAWQVWNEVNSPNFWGGPVSARAYANLVKLVSSTVHGVDRTADIVLSGLFPNPTYIAGGQPAKKFLTRFYKVKKIEKFFEAVSIHPYASTPKELLRVMTDARELLVKLKDKKARLWITEMGWATSGIDSQFTVDYGTQARYARSSLKKLKKQRKKLKLDGVIWYSLRDNLSGLEWLSRSGLLEQSGIAKPAWAEFVRFTGGSP
ncbi:MAG: hypothetical protein ACRD21_19260, partial [Vicinamibacteria bacterium]